MDRGMVLFLGCMLTFTSSWLGLILIPQIFLSEEQPRVVDEISRTSYPRPMASLEEQGRDTYKANGCIYCHSQYVRSEKLGGNSDILRGWGGNYSRRSVSRTREPTRRSGARRPDPPPCSSRAPRRGTPPSG